MKKRLELELLRKQIDAIGNSEKRAKDAEKPQPPKSSRRTALHEHVFGWATTRIGTESLSGFNTSLTAAECIALAPLTVSAHEMATDALRPTLIFKALISLSEVCTAGCSVTAIDFAVELVVLSFCVREVA